MPLYICRESAEITSPSNFLASLIATSDLPDAVGPQMTIILGLALCILGSILEANKKATGSLYKERGEREGFLMTGSRIRILLVEDEALVRINLERLLTRHFEVVPACDGEEALNVFLEMSGEFNLIITDCRMPRMSGMQLCRELKKLCEIPVLLCSASATFLTDEERNIFDGIVSKPVKLPKFFGEVNRLCTGV